ncbi:MAG TPA: hypothetical protein VMT62_14165 [Syntrophorhabdaceae bacterium]|nr:hypothetical protein [Syntrophorhabdaceae bacterium]
MVGSVYNSTVDPTTGLLRFQYLADNQGIANNTSFTFNSFQLKGSGTVIFKGFDQNGNQVGMDQGTLTSNFQLFTENWQNVYSVQFFGPSGLGNITMDNVTLNEAVPTPIPPGVFLLGSGLIGLIGINRKKFWKA